MNHLGPRESEFRMLEARGGSLPKSSRASAESRLALAEQLVASDSPVECARRCMEWIGKVVGIRRGLCLVADAERLKVIATWGGSQADSEGLSVGLEER